MMQELLEAVWRWHATRGAPRRVERDAELMLQKAVEKFFGKK